MIRAGAVRVSLAASVKPELFIDAPTSFDLPSRYLRLRGWCYLAGTRLTHVKLVLPDLELFGIYGFHRPDVPKVFASAPDEHTGFELWARIPPGKHRFRLQFKDGTGAWHTALDSALAAPWLSIPFWCPGARVEDLVQFQFGARPSHFPRPIRPERFPFLRSPAQTRPKLSVVTPSFNQRPFLAQTIESVLAQTGVQLEYSVQDGGSTDGSVELLRASASRLGSWESARDAGQADAIAKAFARTRGAPEDVMAWLNSDDMYLPGALAYVADYFARHPEVDVVYGQRILIDEQSREIGRWFLPPHDDAMLKLNDYVPQEALFWRRRIWDRVGGINPAFKFAMDWDLLLRFQAAGARIARVPYFLACFRVHPAQKTTAQMESLGSAEINQLRVQAQGRQLSPAEVEGQPLFLSYLRRSAWRGFLWKLGIRAP